MKLVSFDRETQFLLNIPTRSLEERGEVFSINGLVIWKSADLK